MLETTRDRLAIVSKRIEILEVDASKKFQDAALLRSLRTKLNAEILTEEKLLAGKWKYIVYKHDILLEATDELAGLAKLRELLSPDYHESFPLWRDATCLCIDDGEWTLHLPFETAAEFIREHGIIVGMTAALAHRDEMLKRLDVTNTLLTEMGFIDA